MAGKLDAIGKVINGASKETTTASAILNEATYVGNIGKIAGEATAGSVEGRIIAKEVTGIGQVAMEEAGIGEARVGSTPQKVKPPVITEPRNLTEHLVLQEAKTGAGKPCMKLEIKDPNYPPEIWQKMHHQHTNPDGTKINIHFWENKQTGERAGFKFKEGDN